MLDDVSRLTAPFPDITPVIIIIIFSEGPTILLLLFALIAVVIGDVKKGALLADPPLAEEE